MQFVPFEDDIEVNGQTVYSVVVEPNEWIPQELWLRAFKEISEVIGAGALYGIGLQIPECAFFPPWVTDVHSAIRSVDVAYHLNHRRAGRVMFDPETNRMEEGIGHYGYMPIAGEPRILVKCTNPYPCDFDKGILTAMARRFASRAWVDHLEPDKCRKRGGDACTYLITWGDD